MAYSYISFISLKRQIGKCHCKGIDFHVGISPDVQIKEQSLTWWGISLLA